MRIAQNQTTSRRNTLRLSVFRGPGGQAKDKGAGNRPFVFNFPTPDIAQGLPGLPAPQKALNLEGRHLELNLRIVPALNCAALAACPRRENQVRLIPDVSAAAYKQEQTEEVILWHCLGAIDNSCNHGNGFLLLETALEQLQSRFHFTEPTAYRHILNARGKVLDIIGQPGSHRIEIYGRRRVILWLKIDKITVAHFSEIADSQFQGLGMRKAQLYSAINKPAEIKGATPKARVTIEKWTGVSRLQQWRYDKVAGTRKIPNYAFYWDEAKQKYVPAKQPIFSKCKGHREMNKRKGQTYHTKQVPGGTGMLRRIANELRAKMKDEANQGQASLYPISDTPMRSEQAATFERCYYFRSSALVKAITRRTRIDKSGYYLIPQGKRMIAGRQEWCYLDTE